MTTLVGLLLLLLLILLLYYVIIIPVGVPVIILKVLLPSSFLATVPPFSIF